MSQADGREAGKNGLARCPVGSLAKQGSIKGRSIGSRSSPHAGKPDPRWLPILVDPFARHQSSDILEGECTAVFRCAEAKPASPRAIRGAVQDKSRRTSSWEERHHAVDPARFRGTGCGRGNCRWPRAARTAYAAPEQSQSSCFQHRQQHRRERRLEDDPSRPDPGLGRTGWPRRDHPFLILLRMEDMEGYHSN